MIVTMLTISRMIPVGFMASILKEKRTGQKPWNNRHNS